MSSRSARTYSWGGDGERFFFVLGDRLMRDGPLSHASRLEAAFPCETDIAWPVVPSSEEREDSGEESESDAAIVGPISGGCCSRLGSGLAVAMQRTPQIRFRIALGTHQRGWTYMWAYRKGLNVIYPKHLTSNQSSTKSDRGQYAKPLKSPSVP